MAAFGKRNAMSEGAGFAAVERRGEFSNNVGVERREPTEFALPQVHNSHFERFWPAYAAAAFACYAAYYFHFEYGNNSVVSTVFGTLVVAVIWYFIFNGFRRSINNLYLLRSGEKKSKSFKVGAGLGAAYWIYSTFISPTTVMGQEFGPQTALYDGFQREDLAAIAQLLLSFGGYALAGGLIANFVMRRFSSKTENSE